MKAHHFVPALLAASPPDERSVEGDHDYFSHPAEAAASRVPKGEKPGGIAVKTTQVAATVEDIDYPKREVKLKGPEGNIVKIKVGDRVKRLDEVKKGDQVVARYTEALAVSLAKPEE